MSLLRGAMQLGSFEVVATMLRFVRTIVVARLLGPEEYGVASTFLIVIAFVEAITAIGIEQYLIRDPKGGSRRFLAVIQSLLLIRALALALALLLLAEPIAAVMNQPDLVNAYRALAIVPLLRGLTHAERLRRIRALDFRMSAHVDCGGIAVSLLLVTPLALVLDDHRLMLAYLGVEMAARAVIAARLAPTGFRLGWHRRIARRALDFGWPLLLSAPIVFATAQGDRVIVANQLTADDLGQLGAALALAGTPMLALRRVLGQLFFIALSRLRNTGAEAGSTLLFAFEVQLVVPALAALAVATLGPATVLVVFGEPFRAASGLIGLAGVAVALPLLRGGFTSLAMSDGRTTEPLLTNLVRAAAVPVAFAVAVSGGDIVDILAVGIGGEVASILAGFALFARRSGDRALIVALAWRYLVAFAVLAAVLGLRAAEWGAVAGLPLPQPGQAALPLCLLGLLVWQCRELRTRLASGVRRLLARRRGAPPPGPESDR